MKKNLIYILAAAFLIASCTSEDDLVQDQLDLNPVPVSPTATGSAGSANFEHMVSFGASFAAGVMDGALYTDGQVYSYPAQIAQKLMTEGVGGGTFNQPDINSVNGFTGVNEDGSINGRFFLNIAALAPQPTVGELPTVYSGDRSQLNNFGVGGIILAQALTPATGGPDAEANPAFNPFYQRFATDPSVDGVSGSSILTDAIATGPTFFTSSLGGNDILGYAVNGGANDGIQITSAADFQGQYTALISAMVATGAKGVVMNIAPVIFLPYFRAVPYNPIPLDQASADALNAAYAAYNGGLDLAVLGGAITQEEADRRTIAFTASAGSAFVMEDENLTDLSALGLPNYRLTEATDLVPLPAAAAFAGGVGTSIPAVDRWVLTIEEQTEIITAAATYSAIIQGVVDATNAAAGETMVGVVDIYPLLADVTGLTPEQATALAFTPAGVAAADGTLGIQIGGQTLAPDFSPGGIYSTDGIHPNPRGYALFANAFIETINTTYGASVPTITDEEILSLRGIFFQ
ncbi:MAG: hypothetical protein R8G66_34120 [Cytophagales bacterium]|nr:hypothetical protein [Cytophagales bacterium]